MSNTQDFIIHMRQFDNFFRDGGWNCLKCGANNVSQRTFCFKPECKAPKPREERGSYRGDRRDSGGPHPGDQRQFGQAQPPQSTVKFI